MSHYDGFYHYLPINDAAMDWGVYVTGAGRGVVPPGEPYPPPGHPTLYAFQWATGRTLPEFQLVLVTGGEGVFESPSTGRVAVPAGSLIFLLPGVWHRYRPDRATGWTERWIGLNGATVHRSMEGHLLRADRAVCPLAEASALAGQIDAVLDRIHANPAQNSILLAMRAMAILAEALEQSAPETPPRGDKPVAGFEHVTDPLVSEALAQIWTHSHRPLSVAQLADRLPATRRTLDRRFVAAMGHSVLEEINACRLTRAERLLTETTLPVKTIAHLAGFSSAERMRAVFVDRCGHAPVAYRDSHSRKSPSRG
jgi:AraC-like DNA-binding protein